MMIDAKLLTTGTLGIAIPASESQIRAALRGGIIHPIKVGKLNLFRVEDLAAIREALDGAGLYTPCTAVLAQAAKS